MMSAGPRIVLVTDSLDRGGAQRQLVLIFLELRRAGHDVTLVYYQPVHTLLEQIGEEDRGAVVCLASGASRDPLWRLARRMRSFLRSRRPDAVISFLRSASTLVAMVRATGLDFAWIASERGGTLGNLQGLRRVAGTAALRRADRVVPNSSSMVDILISAGVRPERIVPIPNGIRLQPEALQAPIERQYEPVRLLVVGNRTPEKNHPALFDALATLNGRGWMLDHLGRTTDHPHLDELVQRAIKRGQLGELVHEHGSQPDPGRWYQHANVLLHPSLSEGFPNVILEAWMWGCPVLVSRRGDLPVIVEHGETGITVDIDEPGALEQALRAVTDEPQSLWPLAQRARQRVIEVFDIARVAQTWLNLCRDLVEGGR